MHHDETATRYIQVLATQWGSADVATIIALAETTAQKAKKDALTARDLRNAEWSYIQSGKQPVIR